MVLEPLPCGRRVRILLTQALDELHDEGRSHGRGLERLKCHGAGGTTAEPEEVVRKRVGVTAGSPTLNDPFGQAPEILDEHDAQQDRNGPELSDGQRLHALEAADEATKCVGFETTVGVRDEGPREAQHARVILERPLGELRELTVVATGQILANVPQGVLDNVEVVHEPLCRRRDGALFADHLGEAAVALEQDAAVVAHARGQRPAPRCRPGAWVDVRCARRAVRDGRRRTAPPGSARRTGRSGGCQRPATRVSSQVTTHAAALRTGLASVLVEAARGVARYGTRLAKSRPRARVAGRCRSGPWCS